MKENFILKLLQKESAQNELAYENGGHPKLGHFSDF
jgi:hypothetical protein